MIEGKTSQVVMLPFNLTEGFYPKGTPFKSRLYNGRLCAYWDNKIHHSAMFEDEAQHICFISTDPNEEIKEGDWFVWIDGLDQGAFIAISMEEYIGKGEIPVGLIGSTGRKIIASTDPALGLPAIPLTWIRDVYVRSNGSIKEVKLKIDEDFDDWYEQMELKSYPYYKLELTPDNEVCITDWHDGKVWNEIWLGEPQPCKLTCIRPSNERQVQTVLIPSSGIEPLYQETYKRSIVTDQELEDVAKDHADNWWDSEPDPETDKHFTEEFNEAKKKWAKHDFICGFEQGANWKAEQLAKEIESRTEVIKEYQKAIDQSANDAMEFAKWTQKNDWWYIDEHDYWMEGKWFDTDLERFPSYTLKQIYEIWQQNR